LSSPNVIAYAREHYGCSSITKFPFENNGGAGSAGSHPEKTAIGQDLMTATVSSTTGVYSKFTIAILRDSNWYAEVDDSYTEELWHGKNRGCGFLEGSCSYLSQFDEFSDEKGPTFDGFGWGGYSGGSGSWDCGNVSAWSNAKCTTEERGNMLGTRGGNFIGYNSRAYLSNIGSVCASVCARCYDTRCDEEGNLTITVEDKEYHCNKGDDNLKINVGSAYLFCPRSIER